MIYLFGDARQLHPYELVRPSEEDLRGARGEKAAGCNRTNCNDGPHHVHVLGSGNIVDQKGGRRDSTGSDDASSEKPKNDWGIVFSEPIDIRLIAPYLALPSGNTSPTTSTFSWEIESSNASITDKRFKAGSTRGVFAPMVEALSPVVSRAQWTIIMRSATVGFIIAMIVCGLCTLRM